MNDLPAIHHDHDGPTEHKHEGLGPGHYIGSSGHFHLTEVQGPRVLPNPLDSQSWPIPAIS